MTFKTARWCSRCRVVHNERCPNAPKWEKKVSAVPKSGRGGRPWQRKRKRVFERDGYMCQIHLKRGDIKVVTLHGKNHGVCDHIVPLEEGGSDDESNLQTICQCCDKEKTQLESLKGRGVVKP